MSIANTEKKRTENVVFLTHATDRQEQKTSNKNAFRIKKPGKLQESQKTSLNELGCHFDTLHKSYVCPIDTKNKVLQLFNEYNIKPDLIDVDDPSPGTDKKTNNLETRIFILEEQNCKNCDQLMREVGAYDKNRGIEDFEEAPKKENLAEGDSENKKNIRFDMELDFHKRYKQLQENEKKLESLKNDLKLHKEDGGQRTEILECLSRNEIGDAEMFVKRFKEKYIFDQTEGKSGAFYVWNGRYWDLDLHKARYKDFDAISEDYLHASKNNNLDDDTKEALEKRSNLLRTDRRRRNVLETVSAYLSFRGKWDIIPGWLPCNNGLVDLSTGEFIASTPERYIKKVCPVNYNENATCPKFETFLREISLEDEEWVSFLQRSLGYAIFGVPKEEVLIYWYGEGGRNGKGTLAKVLQHVLGTLVKSFPAEMLLLQRNPPSSSTPSPELANLEGVRLALISEINEGRKIDSAKVKNLSGRDTIPCRRLFSNIDLQIEPTHTMVLQTNYKPKAPAEDNALWARNILMPFKVSFVRNPQKENERPLKEGLKEELMEEAEGILAWVVQGSLLYKSTGLRIPASILEHTENYRKENDGIGCFLEERCVQREGVFVPKSTMQREIQTYCEKNGFNRPNRTEISTYLKSKFSEERRENIHCWFGVEILETGI